MPIRVLLASDPNALEFSRCEYTVEAEYGDRLVEGSVKTLAHHGSRSANPAPCLEPNNTDTIPDHTSIGISHMDLDTLGGVLAILGIKPKADSFWELAAFVDVNGLHKLSLAEASEKDIKALYAYLAYSQDHEITPEDDGVKDVLLDVMSHANTLCTILEGNKELLGAGVALMEAEDALNKDSFIRTYSDVILRVHDKFVNHIYTNLEGKPYRAVVAYNPTFGSITASLADADKESVHIGELMKELFGEEAGGHKGIGGSERDKKRPMKDAMLVVGELVSRLY